LATCYVAGLPFYGRDLISTALVVTLAFGVPVAVQLYRRRKAVIGGSIQ